MTFEFDNFSDEQLKEMMNELQEEISRRKRAEVEELVNHLFETIEKLAALDKNGICVQTRSNAFTWMALEQNIFENYLFQKKGRKNVY